MKTSEVIEILLEYPGEVARSETLQGTLVSGKLLEIWDIVFLTFKPNDGSVPPFYFSVNSANWHVTDWEILQ